MEQEKPLKLDRVGALFDEAWAMYKERFAPLARIVLLPALVTILGYTIADLHFPFSSPLGGVILFIGWLLSVFNVLPLVISIQHNTDIDDSYRAALPLVLPFALVIILEAFAVLGGFIMLIVPGIWMIFAFSFVSYIFVIEHRRSFDALRQSADYIQGYWWAVLGRVVLMGIFVLMASAIVQWAIEPLGSGIANDIAAMLLSVLTTPFTTVFGYKLYQNLRTLKPELAGSDPSAADAAAKDVKFVKASVIVGVVGAVLLVALGVYLSWHGMAHALPRY